MATHPYHHKNRLLIRGTAAVCFFCILGAINSLKIIPPNLQKVWTGRVAAAWADGNSTLLDGQAAINPAPMNDIHDIKPVLDFGPKWGWPAWLLIVLTVLAASLVTWWLWHRRRTRPEGSPTELLPTPEQDAYARLDDLAADRTLDGKLYYFRLSAILRGYVERRYEIPAAEMTVEELLPHLDGLRLPPEWVQPLKVLCRSTEPIKFADAAADPDRMPEDLNLVRDFVRRTTPTEIESPGHRIVKPPENRTTEQPTSRITG